MTLAERDIVAGKVVPAAPARQRGVPAAGAHELQRVAARGWPALETERLGEWTLRASHGFTSRANSVLPLGDPGTDLDSALERVTRWYAARDLPACIQVTTGAVDADPLLAEELDGRGWTAEKHTVLRVGALAGLADRAPDPRVRVRRTLDDAWLAGYRRAEGAAGDAAARVLSGGPSVFFALVPADAADAAALADAAAPAAAEDTSADAGTGAHEGAHAGAGADAGAAPGGPARPGGPEEPGAAAIGRCVVDGRWAGFAALEVAPEHRRKGLATAVMAELARAALQEGASAAYLQVEADNAAALALYDRLGFTDHHVYHYRRAPERSGT